jgi:hypothetical protein
MACSLAESFAETSYSSSPEKARGEANPLVFLLDDRIARRGATAEERKPATTPVVECRKP